MNSDLTNDLGNLVQRVLSMIIKYNDGKILDINKMDSKDIQQLGLPEENFKKYCDLMNNFEFSNALIVVWSIIRKTNTFVDYKAPWKLFKEDKDKLNTTLNILINTIYKINILLQPFLPISAKKIFKQLNMREFYDYTFINKEIKVGSRINKPEGVFPRI